MTGFHDQRGARGVESAAADLQSDLAWFRGRSVMITGHTGFKGSWLALWLHELGAHVSGYALDPPTTPSNFVVSRVADALAADHRADIRDRSRLERAIRDSRPEVVLHLAAQSVVLAGYEDPTETFSVNMLGTSVLLDAIRAVGLPCAVLVVTSDKCYANDESGRRFVEDDPLGGDDPYSASKAGTGTRRRRVSRLVLPDRRDRSTRCRDSPQRGQETSSAAAIGPRTGSSRTSCERSRTGQSRAAPAPECDPAMAARARAAWRLPHAGKETRRPGSGDILARLEPGARTDRRGQRSGADRSAAGGVGRRLVDD